MPHQPPQSMPVRSHREIGEQLDLFHLPEHASGQACWHPAGLALYRCLEEFVRARYRDGGYAEVRSPLLCDHSLWERSGHWEKFADKMVLASCQGREGALKPMNCPGHAELYALRPRSYRELPFRVGELGLVHRAERSGELNGLLRARSFVIDDGHVFAAPEQVPAELNACLLMAREVYEKFGLVVSAELSLRPDERLGDDAVWDAAEAALRAALQAAQIEYEERPGDGAFYGPKVDLHVKDSLGRSWQMGSVQLDYQLPERFDLSYVGADNSKKDDAGRPRRPVMIHRALLGSLERFIAVLLENDDGWLPLWCAPRQVALLPVSAAQKDVANKACAELVSAGVRAQVIADGPLAGRVRHAHELRVPVVAVVGKREVKSGLLAVRRHGREGQESLSAEQIVALLAE